MAEPHRSRLSGVLRLLAVCLVGGAAPVRAEPGVSGADPVRAEPGVIAGGPQELRSLDLSPPPATFAALVMWATPRSPGWRSVTQTYDAPRRAIRTRISMTI
ncbi:hypothetical protein MOX02_13980 [Methylobacterium oxalidis]|uniref:Uncharacterized protein n=1 Tax=Methylobacterium oxalidis TaxID=944322 RepID=A0A512J062_9HYPH|nr:hypothetical protein MOX02_13980 [Methylobacterium oxalidis]GLS64132.1 hypothetical protein GCM10007888_25130 [Methylobacterium oxalidis]